MTSTRHQFTLNIQLARSPDGWAAERRDGDGVRVGNLERRRLSVHFVCFGLEAELHSLN